MVAGKIAALSKQDYLWQVVPSFIMCSISFRQNSMRIQNKPSLGIKERCCVIGMFVIIMSAEHDWRTDFAS